jgi:potassium/hydrogen antiporter
VAAGAPADGRTIGELDELPEQVWISFVVRNANLVQVGNRTELHAGDEVLLLGDEDCADVLRGVFEGR